MKKIEALISQGSIGQVRELLENQHISNFLFSTVVAKIGHRQHVYRGTAYSVDFGSEVKVEAVVQDDEAVATAYALLKAAGGPGASCKPRVVLTPVNQVILELDEVNCDSDAPTGGLKRCVETPVPVGGEITSPAADQPIGRPALSALTKMRNLLTGGASKDRANEPSRLASRDVDRDWRRSWVPSFWPAHR